MKKTVLMILMLLSLAACSRSVADSRPVIEFQGIVGAGRSANTFALAFILENNSDEDITGYYGSLEMVDDQGNIVSVFDVNTESGRWSRRSAGSPLEAEAFEIREGERLVAVLVVFKDGSAADQIYFLSEDDFLQEADGFGLQLMDNDTSHARLIPETVIFSSGEILDYP